MQGCFKPSHSYVLERNISLKDCLKWALLSSRNMCGGARAETENFQMDGPCEAVRLQNSSVGYGPHSRWSCEIAIFVSEPCKVEPNTRSSEINVKLYHLRPFCLELWLADWHGNEFRQRRSQWGLVTSRWQLANSRHVCSSSQDLVFETRRQSLERTTHDPVVFLSLTTS